MSDIKTQPIAFEYILYNAATRARSMDGLGSSRVDEGKDMKKDLAWPTLPLSSRSSGDGGAQVHSSLMSSAISVGND